jgi:uncharacterized protein YjbI with pentapeptide repeats
MANEEHVKILRQGVDAWNQWRKENPDITPNLSRKHAWKRNYEGANFAGAELTETNFSNANLRGANFNQAILGGANFHEADLNSASLVEAQLYSANLWKTKLNGADLTSANLQETECYEADFEAATLIDANLTEANLHKANFKKANLDKADLSRADARMANFTGATLTEAKLLETDLFQTDIISANLQGADLRYARTIETSFENSDLTGSSIHGIYGWTVILDGTKQEDLIITQPGESVITVDDLRVAQFVYLILTNQNIRNVIDTIGRKAVLILGRFTLKRKAILDAIRDKLRRLGYVPIMFDFDKPVSRNLTETVSALAHMSRFVIADISAAKSIPQELQRIVPNLPSVPVQPIIQSGMKVYGMFDDFYDYASVLPLYEYSSKKSLIASIERKVLSPVIAKATEIESRRKIRQLSTSGTRRKRS